ncbi:hypothetical protein CAL7102_04927 [Dulcicalothrix desertica PCC 7102]|nr:hypothetical protein CAL7102_04927 [Dulcicalothrix desertica PCC 7102]
MLRTGLAMPIPQDRRLNFCISISKELDVDVSINTIA